ITANNVFAHADDLVGIVQGVWDLLAPEGVFVFEVSYLVDVFEKTLFDTIYHEHVAYHSVKPLQQFFADNGMELISAERIDTHGGSLRGVAQLKSGPHSKQPSVDKMIALEASLGLDQAKTFEAFGRHIDEIKAELTGLLKSLKSEGKTIAGFGAPAKATTLMYHFGIGPDIIDFIVDDSPLKQNLYAPGLHIPVLPSQAIYDKKPDAVVILAWNFAEPIMKNHARYLEQGGQFIVPLPKVTLFP
ncbi:MAG: SAM-dependent methyltransferase, partial [Rhodospirillales bacterium]